MVILVIRHGETEANILDVHEGRADFELTQKGHRQAAAMARYVAAIKNEEQGKGHGRLLTEYATNIVIDRGYKEVTLWCVVNNKKARNLYDSLGFKEVFVEAFAEKKTI